MLKKQLETDSYDTIIGFSQGCFMTHLILQWIENKEILCETPKLVILCAYSLDIQKLYLLKSVYSISVKNLPSIHIIGEKDPYKEACINNIALF